MGTIWKEVYTDTEDTRLVLVAQIDGEVSVQTWWLVVGSDALGDYLAYAQPAPDQSPLVEQLITADSIVFTLPPHDDPHVVRFFVSGLDQHIGDPSELCDETK